MAAKNFDSLDQQKFLEENLRIDFSWVFYMVFHYMSGFWDIVSKQSKKGHFDPHRYIRNRYNHGMC